MNLIIIFSCSYREALQSASFHFMELFQVEHSLSILQPNKMTTEIVTNWTNQILQRLVHVTRTHVPMQ